MLIARLTRSMKRILIVLFLITTLLKAEDYELSPFQLSEGDKSYGYADWPNLDIAFFAMAASGSFLESKEWAKDIEKIEAAFESFVVKKFGQEELKIIREKKLSSLGSIFRIDEVVPMWKGVLYKVTYKKNEDELPGYVMLSEGDTFEEIIESMKLSQDFGGITYAVPF